MGFQRIERLERALVHSKGPEGMVGCPFPLLGRPMPHKHNADRRHHIPKMAFKVQNWPEYEAGLRRRGSLTLWIEDAALECWQTYGPGGQARYSDAAVRPDQPDGAHGVQAAVATGRGPACIGPGVDGPDDFSA